MHVFSWRRLCFSGFTSVLLSGFFFSASVNAFQEVVKEEPMVDVLISSGDITFVPRTKEYEVIDMRVRTPTGKILFGAFPLGEKPYFSIEKNPDLEQEVLWNGREEEPKPEPKNYFPDGNYAAEVRLVPSETGQTQNLYFCIENGKIQEPQEEPRQEK